jgi:hypothetical protein
MGILMIRKISLVMLVLFYLATFYVIFFRATVTAAEQGGMYLLTEKDLGTEPGRCRQTSGNTMMCDLTAFSRLVERMRADGYEIENREYSDASIDLILKKEDLSFRLYYRSDRSLLALCSNYEKSYLVGTYISETDGKE